VCLLVFQVKVVISCSSPLLVYVSFLSCIPSLVVHWGGGVVTFRVSIPFTKFGSYLKLRGD